MNKKLTNSYQRIAWVDVAKGLTIFLVVWGHLIEHYNPSSQVYYYIYAFHMPCFFFLSGYVFRIEKYGSVWELIKNKFRTLMVPIYTFGLISLVIGMMEHVFAGNIFEYFAQLFSIKKWICTIIPVRGSGYFFFWYLSALFCTEIILYFQIKYIKNNMVRLLSSIIMFTVGYMIVRIFKLMLPLDVDLALFINIFVLLGYLVKEKEYILKQFDWKKGIVCGMLFFAFGFTNWYFFGQHVVSVLFCSVLNPVLFIGGALFGTLTLIRVSMCIEYCGWIQIVGRTSLVIYCMQGILNRWIYKLIEYKGLFLELILFFCAVLIVVVLTAIGLCIEKKAPLLLGKKSRV